MTFSIIGSGNIAHFFATRLYAKKQIIKSIYSPNIAHAKALAKLVHAKATSNINKIDTNVDAIIIAITDKATLELAKKINFKNTLCIYTSGSISTLQLQNLCENLICVWPVYSITKNNLPELKSKIPTGIVCDAKNNAVILKLCKQINLTPNIISNSQKEILHLSATMLNNFTNQLLSLNENLLQNNKLDLKILLPLLQNTVQKINSSSPLQNQTGPAIRHDASTIATHQNLLKNNKTLLEIYKLFTKSIQATHQQ